VANHRLVMLCIVDEEGGPVFKTRSKKSRTPAGSRSRR
jgi:hypothetical protein